MILSLTQIMSRAFRECLKILMPLVVVLLIFLSFWSWWAGAISGLLFLLILFTIYFFRDPEREVPADEKIIVAGADGLVVGIEEVDETHFQLGKMKRVAIFLSVFDVHINRAPYAGKVKKIIYHQGKFLDVRHPDCSLVNEHLAWHIETSQGPMVVRQIAGLIARRIIAWSKEGDQVERGFRFGMIRFGSRTEIYLPSACEILVKVGDRVQGAASPIARWV
jgi:phosphatidylserine decarboxylase